MQRLVSTLKRGAWVARSRAIAFSAIAAVVNGGCLVYLFVTGHGSVDRFGRPSGTDFSDVWTAGWMANHGRAAAAWDWSAHYAVQQWAHSRADIPFYGWHYPPPFLLVAALLACLPYLWALLAWQGMTLAAGIAVARRIVPGSQTALFTVGFPATYICLGHG